MGSGPNFAQCKPVALLTLMNTLIRVECSLLVLNDIRIIYGKCLYEVNSNLCTDKQ